ncbi:MAG: Rieske (2Fe-2S) protein [Haloferacaceae archaeon]
MSAPVKVCAESDLGPGERELVEVDGNEVGVFNVDGDYYALLNHCPHREGPLCEGDVVPALVGEWPGPGERTSKTADGDPAITCPWHGWEFDLDSGDHLGDDRVSVPTYDVTVEDGVVYVE